LVTKFWAQLLSVLVILGCVGGCANLQPREPKPVRPGPGFEAMVTQVDKIRIERPHLSSAYLKRAIEIVGVYNRMLNSPRMLIRSVQSEADTAIQTLRIDFPQSIGSATDNAFNLLRTHAFILLDTDAQYSDLRMRWTSRERVTSDQVVQAAEEADRAQLEMQILIRRTQENLAQRAPQLSSYPSDQGNRLLDLALKGDVSSLSRLLSSGADVNYADHQGNTALMTASPHDKPSVIELLLKQGANPNAKQKDGYTALIFAAQKGHTAVIQLLLDNGADINAAGLNGVTALWAASYFGQLDATALLLRKGARVDLKGNGSTALVAARARGHSQIVQLLTQFGARE